MIVTVVDPPLQRIVPSTADAVNDAGADITKLSLVEQLKKS